MFVLGTHSLSLHVAPGGTPLRKADGDYFKTNISLTYSTIYILTINLISPRVSGVLTGGKVTTLSCPA